MEDSIEKMRVECWNKALDAFGYMYIYSKRINYLSTLNRWSKVLGILIPVLVGALLTSYYHLAEITSWVIAISTPIAIAQLGISTYLSITGSDDLLNKYIMLKTEYSLLHSEFDFLAKFKANSDVEFENKFSILLERERGVNKNAPTLEDKELRMGMRYGLREYSRSCAGCKETPISMKPSNCAVCGNF